MNYKKTVSRIFITHRPAGVRIAVNLRLVVVLLFMMFNLLNLQPVFASCNPGQGGLTQSIFVPWYKYLPTEQVNGKCTPIFPKNNNKASYDVQKGLPLILIAIIELLLKISGLIAVGFIIFGGIKYITSQGSPEGINGAKRTITNAIVGLIIALFASGLVQFIGNAVK
jgi:hypothetical protein